MNQGPHVASASTHESDTYKTDMGILVSQVVVAADCTASSMHMDSLENLCATCAAHAYGASAHALSLQTLTLPVAHKV